MKKKKRSRLNQQKRRTFYVFQANGEKRKKHARSISYSRLHFVTEPTPNCNLRLLAEHPSKKKTEKSVRSITLTITFMLTIRMKLHSTT